MRILSIAAMLLSFVVTADAQRVSKRFPVISYWDFSFKMLLTPLIVFTIKK